MNMLAKYEPLLGTALKDIDRFMDSYFTTAADRGLSSVHSLYSPLVDIEETNDAYIIEAELPGFDEKNVEVNIDGGTLTIESKKLEKNAKGEPEKNYVLKERRMVSFCRTFRLPENADANTIKAVFKDGILSLEIKKCPETQKRIIPIGK